MKPTLQAAIAAAQSDWAPHIERAARAIVAAAVVCYVAGEFFGRWLHRLNDTVTAMLTRKQAAKPSAATLDPSSISTIEAWAEEYVEQLCAAPTPRSIAPPSDLHPAVLLAASGMSQRAIAAKLGCTRYQVRKALA